VIREAMAALDVGRHALVTGGAGFIGSTLVDRLLSEGWAVTAIDAFESFYPRVVKERNLVAARRYPTFTLIEVDTRDRDRLLGAFVAARPDVVIDLAAKAGVRPSIEDPALYVDINLRGLQNTLDATAEVGARLVFASSSSVYGADARAPFSEDQMRNRPESPYAATKIGGEALAYAFHRISGLTVVATRLFTVFGPRQRPDLAIHKFARRMLRGEPIELYDGGEGLRDYTFIDDLVDGLVRAIDAPDGHHVVNLGSHRPIRTSELVDRLEAALGVKANRVVAAHQAGDVPMTFANIDRARELLGWEPRTDLDDGLRRFGAWLRSEEKAG
jgi:UDP-glucuronate 4-epimerase